MNGRDLKPELLVIPCSGIGKVHGLISREAVYHVADRLLPGQADTVCLALLVTGDLESRQKVQETPCITLDGCPKLCAYKNVELSGGKIAKGIRVYDAMKRHRGANFGTATALSDEGWTVVEELAAEAVVGWLSEPTMGSSRVDRSSEAVQPIEPCAANEPGRPTRGR